MTFYDRLIRALLLRRRHSSGLRTEESRRAFLRAIVLGGVALPFAPGALERIALSSRPSNVELLRLMGRGDQAVRYVYGAFVSTPVLEIIENAPAMKELFSKEAFDGWTITTIGAPVIPLDLTWGAPKPSDLPHSEIESGGIVAPRRRPRDPWDIS